MEETNLPYLRAIQVDENERMRKYGKTYDGNTPEESWFTPEDITRLKNAGANAIEIHGIALTKLMPTKSVNTTYIEIWVDKWVDWITQNKIYCILDITGIGARYQWEINRTFPTWLWEGLYPEPTTKTEYDDIMKDFFSLSVSKQDSNRAAFIDSWKYIANRYKDNKYVMFSIMNEPFCGAYFSGQNQTTLAQSYSTFMENIIDGIRSVGAQQPTLINKPYLWDNSGKMLVKPINRSNIIWEDHAYIATSCNYTAWKNYIYSYILKFVEEFDKPLFIGEYGFDPMSVIRTTYPSDWRSLLKQQVEYLDTLPLVGRQFHNYGLLYGEYYNYTSPSESGDLTEEESEYILKTVLTPPLSPPSQVAISLIQFTATMFAILYSTKFIKQIVEVKG